MKKKKLIIIGCCIVLATLAVIFYKLSTNDNSRSDLSIHDIDWSDVSGMNERIVAFHFSDPPFFEDEWVDAAEHLEDLLQFFEENMDYLRDRGRRNDMEVMFEFENVTGDEEFLKSNEVEGTFTLHFYFDRSLSSAFFELLNASRHARLIAQNPDAFIENEIILFSEVNWSELKSDYESLIYRITIVRSSDQEIHPDILSSLEGFVGPVERASFESGMDNLIPIIDFLERNKLYFSAIEDEEYRFMVRISFRAIDSEQSRMLAVSYLNESLMRELSEVIGEEVWNRAYNR